MYRVVINDDKNGIQSTKVTDELAGRLGMNEEQLFKCAAENTRRLFPPTVRSMNECDEGYVLKGWHAEGDCRDDDWRDSTGADIVGDFQQ